MGAWPILDGSSKEALDSEAECKVVLTVFWQRKEKVKSYQEFLKLRGWKDGSLTCSKAIASQRASIGRPPLFRVWLQKRIAPYPITAPTAAAVGWGNAYGWTTGTVRGTDGVWGNGHGWGHNDGWSDTTSDDGPPWDGVTIVPKTRAFFWTVARLARKQQAGKFTVPDNAAEPRGAFPAAPLSERHGLVPFFLGISRRKRTNKRLPVLAIGSEASEVTLLVISTSLVGGGRHIDCDWNDVMDILSVDILSGERLSLSQIDAGFIGPNEVTFGGKLGPVGSVRVSGSS
ncbi:hypothetical protein B0H14DRAFT_2600452 [Mycena olivaceomarginata]|nr:hypothetical protein B0H14DRAFT_2600452 [Mycena olivaceomarginata]